jgi:hypothetical protein
MRVSLSFFLVPWNFLLFLGFIFLVAAGLVRYALRTKGDVRAVFSHGKTLFELEAKERDSGRRNKI